MHRSGNETDVDVANTMVAFNEEIAKATADIAGAFKLNSAFYEEQGAEGLNILHRTILSLHSIAPDVPIIYDAKRGDIGNTNDGYVTAAFGFLHADAITVHNYLGREAMQPFLDRADKGVIPLCRTSNPGAGEFQDVQINLFANCREELFRFEEIIGEELFDCNVPLYQYVAFRVAENWNTNKNCALVVGATYPEELRMVRRIVGDDMPLLIPGVGFQQKGVPLETQVEQAVFAGKDSNGEGMIINSSRGIIFASNGSDFAEAARRETEKLHNLINLYR